MKNNKKNKTCPCGSTYSFKECCGIIIEDPHLADTPEKLMRSRYTAFSLQLKQHIIATWATEMCPDDINFDKKTSWLGLCVVDTHPDESSEDEGFVTFTARYLKGKVLVEMTEKSKFKKRQGNWFYVDGDLSLSEKTLSTKSICPCGSGKKVKRCCGKN